MILFLTANMATVTSRIQTSYISVQRSSYEMWNYKNAKNRHFVSCSVELPNNNHFKGLSKKNSHAGTKILISS